MKQMIFYLFLLFSLASCREKKGPAPVPEVEILSPGELKLSDRQIQLGNISTDSARVRVLGDEMLLSGWVVVDQNLSKTVSTRVMGRIDKLYFKNTGEPVKKGQPIYRFYSEEIEVAVKELLLSIESSSIVKDGGAEIDHIINSTRRKLELFGLTEEQIKSIEKNKDPVNTVDILSPVTGIITSVDTQEGSYVMGASPVFHLADFSSVWIEVQVYAADMSGIQEGSVAEIIVPSLPGKKYAGKVSFVRPELNPSSRINMIRIELKNEDGKLIPGMQTNVYLLTGKVEVLSLPANAIIVDGKGATVWIKTGPNTFRSKMVETGVEAGGFTEIKSGISRYEPVVITGAYLLNSEYLFRKGTNPMEGHDMNEM